MPLRIDRGLAAAALLTLAACSDGATSARQLQLASAEAPGVFVHESNPVKGLSKAQLKALFTGAIVNWKDVGGPNLPVVACTERPGSGRGTVAVFQRAALDEAPFGPVREEPDLAACLAFVAATPGAIGFAPPAVAIPGVRFIPIDGQPLVGRKPVDAR